MEGNYYANYFYGGSGLVGVGYGDFGALRGLTTGFAGFFAGGTAIFPVRAMGYELCGMRMERSAVGKSKGGDFVGERGGGLG